MIGRNVNLASRVQGFTEGGQILATREFVEAAGDQVLINENGSIWVQPKGIQSEIQLYDIIGFGKQRIPVTEKKG